MPVPRGRPLIIPSVLSADFGCLRESLKGMSGKAGWIHLDIMDGHFVPNLSFGPHIAACLRKATALGMDAHLMVRDPGLFIKPFADAGVGLITVHAEIRGAWECVRKIKALGLKAGLSLRPRTPLSRVLSRLKELDLLLLMSVEPGFGGQAFMPEALPRISEARRAIAKTGRPIWLQVDGGINDRTAPLAVKAGADALVMGSAVFSRSDPAGFVGKLTKDLQRG